MPFDFKNADPSQLKAEYDRIAAVTGDDRFFTRKELNHLPSILADGEQVLAFASGLMEGHTWLISLTDRRIIFLDKGLLFGLKQVAIDLDKVNAVSGQTGIMFGKILIEDSARQRQIDQVSKRTVVPFTNRVRDALEDRKKQLRAAAAPSNSSSGEDVVSKLERLAALKERGVLSVEEFEQQKSRLLAG